MAQTKEYDLIVVGAGSQAIVQHREKNGPFKTIEDIKRVDGASLKMFDQLKNRLTIGSAGGAEARK